MSLGRHPKGLDYVQRIQRDLDRQGLSLAVEKKAHLGVACIQQKIQRERISVAHSLRHMRICPDHHWDSALLH